MVSISNKVEYIAEIGINHEGSISLAKELICAAKESGATIAKFQTYNAEKRAKKHPEIFDILKKSELSIEQFEEIKDYCDQKQIIFSSSPFCEESVYALDKINTKHLKIASFLLTNSSLLRAIKKTKNCEFLYLSTGTCNLEEIKKSMKIIDKTIKNIFYLHCISQYPVKDIKDCNLINISFLKELWGNNVGLSDDSIGDFIPSIAVALGARVIEKHFTTTTKRYGFDHEISATPEVFKKMVEKCNSTCLSIGIPRGEVNYECEDSIVKFKESL